MEYRYTDHAKARINERRVPADWLASVLESPQRILRQSIHREIRQSVFEKDGKRWLLRVVCEGDRVITAILTSKIDRYGGTQ